MNGFCGKSSGLRFAGHKRKSETDDLCLKMVPNRPKTGAFTIPEALIAMVILSVSLAATYTGITCWMLLTHRTSDFTAGMALVQAEIHDIRAADYPGTNGIFSRTSTTSFTNNVTVDLNKGGTTFLVPGTLTSVIQPITWGHLVTVTLVVKETGNSYLTNSLQTVVNNYSGGRGD